MEYKEIVDFVERVKPELDEPGVYVPKMNQYLTSPDQWYYGDHKDPVRICYAMPVPEDSAIQNIGIGILLNIINEQMGREYIGSVHYFPEPKMLKRMKKFGVPLFDNWLFRPLSSFDIIGFSSFFALQYLNFYPMLEMSGIPVEFKDRIDSWDYPVVILGGIQAYSAEAAVPLFDAYLIGEGEDQSRQFYELYRKCRMEGKSKKQFLYEAARDIQGVYLPWAYEFEYYPSDAKDHKNQIKSYRLTDEAKENGVPLKVLKAAIDFKDRKPLTKMLVSNGPAASMTIGSLFCAISCSNLCSFCHGSQTTLPYREIPFDVAKRSAKELIKNTGSPTVTPYCFNVSDLSYVNRFTSDIITELDTRVTLSSERLDMMTDDFVRASVKSGNRTFIVAIEAASPRGRHVLNKNLTEDQILDAFDVMIRNGAKKIKIYNISAWPFETMEDMEYYSVLLGKIHAIRKKYKSKCMLRLSFTPFNPKPHTILQWSKQNNIALDENNNPVMLKPHIPLIPAFYAATDNELLIKFETPSLVQLVAYILNYGDRRMYPVLKELAQDPDLNYSGGMGIGSAGSEAFINALRKLTCLDLDYFLRVHDADEVFPWEAISTGVDKSWLRMFYEKAKKAAESTPVAQEGFLREPCFKSCTYCGVCRSLDKSRGSARNADGSVNPLYFNPEIYGKGRFLPVFEYGDNAKDHDITITDKIDAYLKPVKHMVLRLEAEINPYYRYVDTGKLKYRLRSACLKAGIPVSPGIISASDRILEKAWFSGKEIYELYITDGLFRMPAGKIKDAINSFLDESMSVERVELYSKGAKKLGNNFDYVLYSMDLPETFCKFESGKSSIDQFQSEKTFPVKMKRREKGKMFGFETVEVDAKEFVYDCFCRDNMDGTWTFFAAVSGSLQIYDFAASVLHIAKRNLYRYPAVACDYLLKKDKSQSFDMFADVCDACGKEIELDIWGEPVSGSLCLRHKHLSICSHLSVDASENTDFYAEESDSVQENDPAEFDADMDLEDYVITKTGSTDV